MSEHEIIETPLGIAQLKRTNRRTLAISVLPDGSIELVAPQRAPLRDIIARVEKRARWIRTQQRKFVGMSANQPALRYVNGATHRYLGRQYRLKLHAGEGNRVVLTGGYFHFTGKSDAGAVKSALQAWYRARASEQFRKRVSNWEEWCRNRRLCIPRVLLRSMPKRWGSAWKDGTICLNPELIRAPSACIDYVIVHEICHLKYPNHGPRFRALLQVLCPNWRVLKERLERLE